MITHSSGICCQQLNRSAGYLGTTDEQLLGVRPLSTHHRHRWIRVLVIYKLMIVVAATRNSLEIPGTKSTAANSHTNARREDSLIACFVSPLYFACNCKRGFIPRCIRFAPQPLRSPGLQLLRSHDASELVAKLRRSLTTEPVSRTSLMVTACATGDQSPNIPDPFVKLRQPGACSQTGTQTTVQSGIRSEKF